jgi:RNA polymerase sigma-70 factor (ECF subfamily)
VASLSALTSEGLVNACVSSNDPAAWAEFIRRYQPLIARVVGRTARRQSSASPSHLVDDLVQETYLKLCEQQCRLLKQFRFQHQDSFYGFLKVVAACVVLDHFKSENARKRDASQTYSLSEQAALTPESLHRRTRLSSDDLVALRQIDDILFKLYKDDVLIRNRAIFWFHYREGMTAHAIAAIPWIGLHTKGIETTLRRMTQMIQSHVAGFH